MSKEMLKLMQLENRYRHLESKGNSEISCGVMRKVARQIKKIKVKGIGE